MSTNPEQSKGDETEVHKKALSETGCGVSEKKELEGSQGLLHNLVGNKSYEWMTDMAARYYFNKLHLGVCVCVCGVCDMCVCGMCGVYVRMVCMCMWCEIYIYMYMV